MHFRQIVGVVADIKQKGLDVPAQPALYTPFLQDETNHDFAGMNLFLRTAGDPRRFAAAIRTQVHAVRSGQPVNWIRTMNDVLFQSLAPRRFGVVLLASFAGVALALSAIGIYGMIAYSVNQRTREMGLRMALGARRTDVLNLVMREGLLLTVSGVVLGVLISIGLTRTMSGILFGITPTDIPTFLGASGLLIAVAALACLIPALRAAGLDPITALREN